MLGYLILLFVTVPLIEMGILIEVGKRIGTFPTVFVVVVTGIIGATLARYEGLGVIKRIHKKISSGMIPSDSLMDGLLILIAGALLITPGLLTDITGFLFLVPAFRLIIKRQVSKKIKEKIDRAHIKVYYDYNDNK